VIDPRTLSPLDKETILRSVKKTGRLIVADEGCLTCGFASEVSSIVAQEAFDYLKAPVIKVGSPNTPAPYSPPLEAEYIPGIPEIRKAIECILNHKTTKK
jgi:pyruvate dehydrogenase E1 component beta subunit